MFIFNTDTSTLELVFRTLIPESALDLTLEISRVGETVDRAGYVTRLRSWDGSAPAAFWIFNRTITVNPSKSALVLRSDAAVVRAVPVSYTHLTLPTILLV